MSDMLVRHSPPCEFDQHPYGTVCKVNHGDIYDIYLQVSHDEDHPNWEFMGDFSNTVRGEYILNMIDTRLRKNIHYD